jgi:hypothetical protein
MKSHQANALCQQSSKKVEESGALINVGTSYTQLTTAPSSPSPGITSTKVHGPRTLNLSTPINV